MDMFIFYSSLNSIFSSHSHPHGSINSGSSVDKKYYSNIMEIIKGSDLLSPTDSLRTLPHDYNE